MEKEDRACIFTAVRSDTRKIGMDKQSKLLKINGIIASTKFLEEELPEVCY